MDKITGAYNLESQDGTNECMKELGAGMVMRILFCTLKPEICFIQNGDTWTMKTSTTFKNTEIKFKIGEEFEESTIDGRDCKTIFSLDDGNLIQVQKFKARAKADTCTLTYYFTDTEMKMVCECNGVKSTNIFKRT